MMRYGDGARKPEGSFSNIYYLFFYFLALHHVSLSSYVMVLILGQNAKNDYIPTFHYS